MGQGALRPHCYQKVTKAHLLFTLGCPLLPGAMGSHQCAKPPPLCAATSVQGPVFVFPKLRFSPSCSLTRLFVHSVYTHLLKARYGTVDGDTLSPSLRFSH